MDVRRAYERLEVRIGATNAEVHAAYRRLAWRWHPDRLQSDPVRARRGAEELAQINAAYAAIRRAGFPPDAAAARPPPAPSAVAAPPPASFPPPAPRPVPMSAPRRAPEHAVEDDERVLWVLVWLVLVLLTLGALGEHGDD